LDSLEQQFASLLADFENGGGEEEEELDRRRSELRVIKEKAEKISSIVEVASKIPDPEVEGIMLTSDSSKRRNSDSSRIMSLSASIAKLLVQAEMQELGRAADKVVVEAAMVNTADKQQQQQQQAEVQEVDDAADKEEAVQEEGDAEGGGQEEEASRIEAAVRTKHMHPLANSHSFAHKKRPLAYHTHTHESSIVTTGSINESTKRRRRRRRRMTRRMTRRRRGDMLFYAGKDTANSEGNDIEGAHAVEKGAGRASGSAKTERDCGERRGGGVKEEAGAQAGRG
jgi:hypothetical protein